MKNRAGETVSVLSGDAKYLAYKPNKLPPFPAINLDENIVSLLSKAHNLLGRLDTMAKLLPDRDLFIGAYVRKEALLSSQIEGTQATIEDIFSPENEDAINLEVDDVINYVEAINFAIDKMKELPLCNRLLCLTHSELLKGVRGQEKNPGEFRRSQNWIGATGSTLKNARYIPPTVEDMKDCMSDLEKYINESDMDVLLKTALVHYQFETIHPFLDGNGRIGRMLITLMLLNEKGLTSPVLYMSLFLKTNRIEYYDRLSEVRLKGDYEQWINFFLTGVIETCNNSIEDIEKITCLTERDSKKLISHTDNVKLVYGYIKEHPIVNITGISKGLKLSYNTVASCIKQLVALDIVKEQTGKKRDKIYCYQDYLDILKSGTDY